MGSGSEPHQKVCGKDITAVVFHLDYLIYTPDMFEGPGRLVYIQPEVDCKEKI